ncbi:MAG: hypothetical protein ABIH69_02670 [bacterium]
MNITTLIWLGIGLVLGALLFFVFHRLMIRGKYVAQSDKPLFSEKEAENLLKKNSYVIIGRRLRETVITNINGSDHFGYIQADYLVEKLKKRFPVLVFAGEGSPDPNEENFRRRLLELDKAYRLDGVLVLNLNKMEIYQTRFRFPRERNIDFYFRFLGGLFIIAAVIGIIWLLVHMGLI